jgi:Methylase involved in ubiquinone/menaquinone biosynthesis
MDEATQRTIAAYAEHAVAYAQGTARYDDYPQVARIMNHCERRLNRGSVVLDIGCGAGRESRFFAGRGHKVVAVDLCAPLLETWHPSGSVLRVVGDMRKLPLPDEVGDALVATSSIIHLPPDDLNGTMLEFRRALVVGGVLLLTFPVVPSSGWFTRESLPAPRWFSRFSIADIQATLRRSGFAGAAFQNSGTDWISVFARKHQ